MLSIRKHFDASSTLIISIHPSPTAAGSSPNFQEKDTNSSIEGSPDSSTSPSPAPSTVATAAITITETTTASPSSVPATTPIGLQNDNSLPYDSIIIASVLGGITILLIISLAAAYFLLKYRKRRRELDYSPPFTSFAPPPRSALSQSIRYSTVPPEGLHETSLSMGPGSHDTRNSLHQHQHQHPQGTAPQYQPSLDVSSQGPSTPTIIEQPSTPGLNDRSGRRSQLYHDVLREESEYDAAKRRKGDAPMPKPRRAMSTLSALSDVSDIDNSQLRPGIGIDRGRFFPSTRASSGVFPDD